MYAQQPHPAGRALYVSPHTCALLEPISRRPIGQCVYGRMATTMSTQLCPMQTDPPDTPQPQSLNLFDELLAEKTEKTAVVVIPSVTEPLETSPLSAPELDDSGQALAEQAATPLTAAESLTLPADARRALVTLLRQGVVLGTRKKGHFEALLRHESAIRAQLANLYLSLLLDEKSQLAMIKQREAGEPSDTENHDELDSDEEIATLISRRPLTLYDSLVLLVLRRHFQQRETEGASRILIDQEHIDAQLRPFLPLTNSSSRDARKLSTALDKFEKHKLLLRQRGEDNRFEITPVIRFVVNAELLQRLLGEYQELADGMGIELTSEATPDA